MIHIRFEGQSYDMTGTFPTGRLDDREVRARVAKFLEVPVDRLRDYVVERRPNGTVVVRPEAVYG